MSTLLRFLLFGVFLALPVMARAGDEPSGAFRDADIIFLGEVHDNPHHHLTQAEFIKQLSPRAIVWEMLPDPAARAITPDLIGAPTDLAAMLNWDSLGWPSFALYAPVFAASGSADHYGALVPRSDMPIVIDSGILAYFGPRADSFGLSQVLPPAEQNTREADQLQNHCNALPEDLLPFMVDVQRLRDALLARSALDALAMSGGPVAVITGNGHARKDRGAPVYLRAARADLKIASLGQSEEGAITGVFDQISDAPRVIRPDPCLAFQ